jgi:tRNA threonylcarbamoyladenosine biosynthesis protein TsaB
MITLGIETSNIIGSVAIVRFTDDLKPHILGERIFQEGMVHGRELAPAIDSICKQNALTLNDIDLVAVDVGPGSYTGLRIGIACAKGIAYALKKAIVSVCSLESMAVNFLSLYQDKIPSDVSFILPAIDAKWRQIYAALFELKTHTQLLTRKLDSIALAPDEFIKLVDLPRATIVFGDAIERYSALFEKSGFKIISDTTTWYPKASTVAIIGTRSYKSGKIDDVFKLVPRYLRPTEAELKFGRSKEKS